MYFYTLIFLSISAIGSFMYFKDVKKTRLYVNLIFNYLKYKFSPVFQNLYDKYKPEQISELRVVNHKYYELDYMYKGKKYTKRFHKKIQPPSIIKNTKFYIKDGEIKRDITEKIEPYIGVNNDFHGVKVSPAFLGINDNIILEQRFDDKTIETEFHKDSPIDLNC